MPQWDDGFSKESGIPEYKAYNDSYAQGYIGQLKKNGNYNKYIKEVAKPGGIKPIRQKSVISSNKKEDQSQSTTFAQKVTAQQ